MQYHQLSIAHITKAIFCIFDEFTHKKFSKSLTTNFTRITKVLIQIPYSIGQAIYKKLIVNLKKFIIILRRLFNFAKSLLE